MKETNSVTGSVIIVGSGLAGMVAGYEALKGGEHVIFWNRKTAITWAARPSGPLAGCFMSTPPSRR